MPKALVVYASWTGNNEAICKLLGAYFKQLEVEVTVTECQQVDPSAFKDVDICVIATYTWGSEGELPDEMQSFFKELGRTDLRKKIFGCLGSGEEFYGYFCKSVDDFDHQFEKTGAIRGAEVVKIEVLPDEKGKQDIMNFAKSLLSKYHEIIG